jgi:hypothetical protein
MFWFSFCLRTGSTGLKKSAEYPDGFGTAIASKQMALLASCQPQNLPWASLFSISKTYLVIIILGIDLVIVGLPGAPPAQASKECTQFQALHSKPGKKALSKIQKAKYDHHRQRPFLRSFTGLLKC